MYMFIYSKDDRAFELDIITHAIMLFIILTFYCVASRCVHSKELTGVVQTDKGLVQGEIRKTIRKSTRFSSFRGIRYGEAPAGFSRFKPPEEAEPWSEIFDATKEGTPCPHIDASQKKIFTDEDCLNLNVYSPKTNFNPTDGKLLPVMVWIHGGSFIYGSTDMSFYGPDFLIENGVVVVAMNYRLGILGFLSLNLPGATGNAGLKDQQLALKWVQKNIEQFGGDPDSVTIFGQSAGAAAVEYHVLADESHGLFHRSISMSGSPLCLWAFSLASQAEQRAFRVGSLLGINTTKKEDLLGDLYRLPVHDLLMATAKLTIVDPPFKPSLEDAEIAGPTAFLSECSVRKYNSGNFSRVPSIIGFMANEALSFTKDLMVAGNAFRDSLKEVLQVTEEEALDFILHSHDVEADAAIAGAAVTNDTYWNIITMLTDVLFVSGIDTEVRYLAHVGDAALYYYRNSFAPYTSYHRLFNGIDKNGAAHGDDLAYCWYISTANFPTDPNDPFVIMQNRITRMWTNFAKYSNPTPFGNEDLLLNISWPDSGLEGIHLEIDDEFSVGDRPIDGITELHEIISRPSLGEINGC